MDNDKTMGCIGKIASAVGIVCYIAVAIGVIACLNKGFTKEDVALILFFAFLGVILRIGAKRRLKKTSVDEKPKNDGELRCTPIRGEPKAVHCPNCGANNTIYSSIGECEYCGSPLRSEGKK